MGDYAITKIILKVKEQFVEPLQTFLEELKVEEKTFEEHTVFWNSLGIQEFKYQDYVFNSGSYHAYTTALGDSDCHIGSNFYVDENYSNRFEDGLWFVEFSSKTGQHRYFIETVVPKIADGWLGLYGNEYISKPEELAKNPNLITSDYLTTHIVIKEFKDDINSYSKSTPRDRYLD